MPGDYTGNGNTDFACLKYKRDGNNNIITSNGKPICIRFDLFVKNNYGAYIVEYTETINDKTVELIPGDLNGDGKQDLIRRVGNSCDFMISNGSGFSVHNYSSFNNISADLKIRLADFDGDGKDEVFTYLIRESAVYGLYDDDGNYIGEELVAGETNIKLYKFTNSPSLIEQISLNWESIVNVANVTGNGKANILIKQHDLDAGNSLNFIYEMDENNVLIDINDNNSTIPNTRNKGDFNGDGKTDFLYFSNNSWKIKHSTGTGFAEAVILPNLNVSSQDNNMIYLADFDGNGLTDIIEYELYDEAEYEMPVSHIKHYYYYYHINIHFNYGYTFEKKFIANDTRVTVDYYAPNYPVPYYHQKQPSLDVNGDGKQDFVGSKFGDGQSTVTTGATAFYPYEKKHLVKSITNGYNNKTQFYFKPLTDASVYTIGTGANFPAVDFRGALYVVKNLTVPNGIGNSTTTQNYFYEGAKIHRQGKGFLGFTKIKTENLSTNIVSETEFEYNITYYNTYPIYSKTYFDGIQDKTVSLISSSTITNQYIHHFGNKRIFTYPKETESTNHLTNTTVSSITYIDNNTGNVTSNYSSTDGGNTLTMYQNYITAGAWLPTKPGKTILNKTATGKPLYTRTSEFEYYPNGMLKKSIADPSDAINKIITEYWYNNFGNVTNTSTSALDEETKTSSLTYDCKNRFVISQTDPLNFTSYKTYNTETGNILTQTDINGHITKFKYNAFGSLIETESPDGTKAYQTTEWYSGDIQNAKTFTVASADGTAPVKTFFDKLGRKIRTENSGFKNETTISEIEYNSKGQIEKTYEPHFEGEPGNYTTFNFDFYGRQTSVNSPVGTTSYLYNEKISTVTLPDGQQTSKIINSLGQVITAEDNGGTINYNYNSAGLPTTITTVGGATITMTYDDYGNKLSLSDPDAGTINYTYDAFSNIKAQKDANNNIHQMQYDIAGRITEKSGTEGTTTYVYDTAPNGKAMLTSESGINGNTKTYVYDNLSRMQSVTETFEGEDYTYSYNYDNLGRISTMTYPNGFSYTKEYKDNGYLQQINTETSSIIWKPENRNALGQITEYYKGNGLTTHKTYDDYHQLESVVTGSIQHFEYDFEKETGNLLSRTDNYGNTESFTYDNLDRLTQINTNGNIFNTVYNNTGNITNKTDAGIYSYDANKIHAVTNISGNTDIPSENQGISYTSFNKVNQIKEGFPLTKGTPGIKLDFTYGLNNQRKKTVLEENGHITKIKYFFGSYEKTIEADGTITEHCWLPCGAVYKTTNATSELLYTYTDHLGSITHITDDDGNLFAEQSFSAWGRARNPETWEIINNQSSIINGRGYTGHEMLPKFGLINMNGRLYDPILGRMLSPDNHVQASGFTQSFNRYSYVINNPLKYTDPTGQWWGWDDSAVASIGFTIGYVSYGIKNKDWGWKAVGAGGIGAVMAWVGYNTAGLAGGFSPNTWGYVATLGFNAYTNLVMDPIQYSINENWSVSVSPSFFYSTEGFGAGLIGGIHYTNNEGFSTSVYGSAQYGQGYVSKRQGLEFRAGAQTTITGKNGGYFSFGYNRFFSGETSQNDFVVGFGGEKWSFQLEEDYPISDKFRTGAGQFTYKFDEDLEASIGFKAYSGEPDGIYRFYRKNGKIERYYASAKTYKYLSGVLYAGVNYKGQTFQAGMNSEKIRGAIQNGIHSTMNWLFQNKGTSKQIPHFIERPGLNPNSFYYNFGTVNPFSLYP